MDAYNLPHEGVRVNPPKEMEQAMTANHPRWLSLVLAVFVGIFLACLLSFFVLGPRARASAAEEALAMLKDQEAAWNRHDLTEFLKSYNMSETISFFTDDVVACGWVGVNDRYQRGYGKDPDKLMGQLSFTDLVVEACSNDVVVIRGRWTLTQTPKAGTGLFTILVQKTDNGWKIVHDHTSAKPKPEK
jgi:ketosteroid isomerase-like protein